MKTTALCVILILLSIVCHRGHTAAMNNEVINAEDHLLKEESRLQEILFRSKRHSNLSICRFCCNCCKSKGCGLCCLT
ncbi:hepcidin [Mantella aurantiaca]